MTKLNLVNQIASYLNNVNHNQFNELELKEVTADYLVMIETEDIDQLIETMEDELQEINKSMAKYEDHGLSNKKLNDNSYYVSEIINELYKLTE